MEKEKFYHFDRDYNYVYKTNKTINNIKIEEYISTKSLYEKFLKEKNKKEADK